MNAPTKHRDKLRGITDEMFREMWGRTDIPLKRFDEALGVSSQALSHHAKRLGLPCPRRRVIRADTALFRRMWTAGVSSADIAKHFGYHGRGNVSWARKRLGLPERGSIGKTPRLTLAEFWEIELGERMKAA